MSLPSRPATSIASASGTRGRLVGLDDDIRGSDLLRILLMALRLVGGTESPGNFHPSCSYEWGVAKGAFRNWSRVPARVAGIIAPHPMLNAQEHISLHVLLFPHWFTIRSRDECKLTSIAAIASRNCEQQRLVRRVHQRRSFPNSLGARELKLPSRVLVTMRRSHELKNSVEPRRDSRRR